MRLGRTHIFFETHPLEISRTQRDLHRRDFFLSSLERLEHFHKRCSGVQRGFLVFGEAPVKEQV
jgi:hypothetical protein